MNQGIIDKNIAMGIAEFSQEKIVFLTKENLERLRAYKAHVSIKGGIFKRYREIHIVITGLSDKSANQLFESLEALGDRL